MVDRGILMENRQVRTLHEDALVEKSEKTALDLLSR
jgi:hypothetical protein